MLRRRDLYDRDGPFPGLWQLGGKRHRSFDLLSCNTRYKAVIGERDYKTACRAIAAAGYATDPKYADKLVQIIEAYALTAYDETGSAAKPGGSNTTAGTTSPADAKGAGKMKASDLSTNCKTLWTTIKRCTSWAVSVRP